MKVVGKYWVLSLDDCFQKIVCGVQLLSAVCRDRNYSMIPIDKTFVKSEFYYSWGMVFDVDY